MEQISDIETLKEAALHLENLYISIVIVAILLR